MLPVLEMLDPKYLRAQSTSSQAPDTVITKWGSVTVTRDCIQTQFQDDAVQRLLTQHTYRSWGAPGTGSDSRQAKYAPGASLLIRQLIDPHSTPACGLPGVTPLGPLSKGLPNFGW